MNKIEAIKAMLSGKKMKLYNCPGSYVKIDDKGNFVKQDGAYINLNHFREDGWEEYKEKKYCKSWDELIEGMRLGKFYKTEEVPSKFTNYMPLNIGWVFNSQKNFSDFYEVGDDGQPI